MSEAVTSFWFNRFQLREDENFYLFKDMLYPENFRVEKSEFTDLAGDQLNLALFEKGFLKSCIESYPVKVTDSVGESGGFLFWQFPCKTEACAFEKHKKISRPVIDDKFFNIYIALPWATFIDADIFELSAISTVKVNP